MLRNLLFLNILVVFILLAGCSGTMSNEYSQAEKMVEFSTEFIFTSLDEVVEYAPFIVHGEIIKEEEFDTDTAKYTVSIFEIIKGIIEEREIEVYQTKGTYQLKDQALLFLDGWADELYPNPLYTSISPDTIFILDHEAVKGEESLISTKDTTQFLADVKEKAQQSVQVQAKVRATIEKAKDQQELLELSQHVIHLKVKDIIAENKYVKLVVFEVIQQYKGSLNSEIDRFVLPSSVQEGEEYLVFMNEKEPLVFNLATHQGSVISQSDETAWATMVNFLNR